MQQKQSPAIKKTGALQFCSKFSLLTSPDPDSGVPSSEVSMVSAVIPTFGVPKLVARCVKRVAKTKVPNPEPVSAIPVANALLLSK